MLGKQSDQRGLWEADSLYINHVDRGSFYGLLASLRGQLFRDEEFVGLYCDDNGRENVSPSLLATALLLQTYDRVSDAEAKQRADFDIRWKVALDVEMEARPFAKNTLQLFRARLVLHEKARGCSSAARSLPGRQTALLGEIVADADRLLELRRRAQELLDGDSADGQRIAEASQLLGTLLVQDVERAEEGVCLKEGVSRDRMVSVHDQRCVMDTRADRRGDLGLSVQWSKRPALMIPCEAFM